MFQWQDFRQVADELMMHYDESHIRCAISRHYYSLFGSTRQYLINDKNLYEFNSRKNIHERIYRELINSNDSTEYELGEIIGFLRKMRNHADYDLGDDCLSYFEENLEKILEDVETAFNSLNSLKVNPPYIV